MMNVTVRRKRKEKRGKRIIMSGCFLMILFFCMFFFFSLRNSTLKKRLSYQLCSLILKEIAPNLSAGYIPEEDSENSYETETESGLVYDALLAQNVAEENEQAAENTETSESADADAQTGEDTVQTASASAGSGVVNYEKLSDFDYLIQNFYTVDATTTINSSQLSAADLLAKDCTIEKRSDAEPQILIYHTHASEGYCDSVSGDASTTVVGVGEKLTEILTGTYGYNVLHDTGVYDTDRNRAYSVAAPYVEQILKDHPSIEVVIDLHRDGVSDGTRLVTEQNGVSMAQIMFFNGLSRTTAMGDISYLQNPYISDNLAFSFQMQVKATELYTGFSRKIYLKGYRYNMHFCPKSLLIEVGAQTNTLTEALNAMDPLAEILDAVLSGN